MSLYGINLYTERAAESFAEWLLCEPTDPMYLDYLDGLHDAGVKMTTAGRYLREDFGMHAHTARTYVMEWISTTDYDFENEG